MKKIIIGLLLVFLLSGCVSEEPSMEVDDDYISIANWNLQVFGPTKASKGYILDFYDEKLSEYDIIFVQEIRDSSGKAFNKLCKKFEGYNCVITDREGRTSSKEQIGVIYKKDLTLRSIITLPDPDDVWERSPVMVKFEVKDYNFTIYNTHLKPDDVYREINALEDIIVNEGNVMVLGDLNADCSYYDEEKDEAFDEWFWLIYNEEDTTVSDADCAYDRIIVNEDMVNEIDYPKIDSEGITKEYSDHYIVSIEVDVGRENDN